MNELQDKIDFGFFEPVWLAVGLLAVVAVVLLEAGAHRRRSQALRLFVAAHLVGTLAPSVSLARRLWKRLLLIGAVACLFIALARPHMFYRWEEEARTGLDLLVAMDCSKSMLTEDVKPNRLERAKLAVADFADRLPDDRLGLIAFAGDAFLQVPLTLDHDAFQTAVRELDTDTIPRPGTDIAVAINEAVSACASQASNTKILLLITDGEDLEGRAVAAAQNAAKAGVKIYTIGVGTPGGDFIPERDESGALMYLHDSDGNIVKSRLDESTLKQIASVTGGAYVPLGQRGEGLQEIYSKYIATLPRHQVESRKHKVRFEQYEWPLGLSILLLAASMLMGERRRSPAGENPVLPPAAPACSAAHRPRHGHRGRARTRRRAARQPRFHRHQRGARLQGRQVSGGRAEIPRAPRHRPRRSATTSSSTLGDAAYKAGRVLAGGGRFPQRAGNPRPWPAAESLL